MTNRRISRRIMLKNVAVGGGAPVSVQSMTNTDTHDAGATLKQIDHLAALGCEIIRVTVPDAECEAPFREIAARSPIPVVADIHFDHRLALLAIRCGASAIRLNPGNIDGAGHVQEVALAAKAAGIAIRVGSNAGSLRANLVKSLLAQGMSHDEAMAEALYDSAMHECKLLEDCGFSAIKVALKSSSVPITIAACRKFAERTDYPLHVGVTEAGTPGRGIIKSAAGIGALLLDGIGDTIRVSLTADPAEEVIAGRRILEACGLRSASPDIVSCPTCGRTVIDLIGLAKRVEDLVDEIKAGGGVIPLKKIAVMGCAVNGPGEARDADLGIAGSKAGKVVIFRSGEILGAFEQEAGFEFFRQELLKNTEKREK